MSRRLLRLLVTLVVSGLCTSYLICKIDVSRTLHILGHADLWYFLAAVAIMMGSVWPMAWRWQRLLHARRIRDRLSWLLRPDLLAVGHSAVGAYLWIEGAFVLGTVLLAVALFSRRARPLLSRTQPLLRRIWLERPIRAAYEGIHSYRAH